MFVSSRGRGKPPKIPEPEGQRDYPGQSGHGPGTPLKREGQGEEQSRARKRDEGIGGGERGLPVSSRGGENPPKIPERPLRRDFPAQRGHAPGHAPYSPVRGSSNQKVLPVPSWLSTPQRPPWRSITFFTMDSPRPVPIWARLWSLSTL